MIGNQTYATDLVLVNLVRLQQLAAKVNNMFWETIEVTNGGPPGNIHANAMAVASIQKELDTFINQLPSQLQWNCESLAVGFRVIPNVLDQTSCKLTVPPYGSAYSSPSDMAIRPIHLSPELYDLVCC